MAEALVPRGRPVARRRGGALPMTFGYLCVAGTFFLLSGAGPRLIGTTRSGGLTVVVTCASIFGFGIAVPIEQYLSRRLNVDAEAAVRKPLTWLACASVVAVVAAVTFGRFLPAHKVFHPLVLGLTVAAVGWFAVVCARARLAGAGDLTAFAGVLVVEATTRVVLVAAAVADHTHEATLLALAVGVPLLAAAGAGFLVRHPARTGSVLEAEEARAGEQVAFVTVSVGYQVCLNSLPLFLDLKQQGLVAAAGIANSYFLAPTVAMGGITTHALVALSQAWGERDLPAFRRARTLSLRNGAAVALGVTGLAAAAAPIVLPLYYGHSSLGLPFALLTAMALSTVVTVIAAVAMQPLLAAGHGRWAAWSWALGAAVTVVGLALSNGTDLLADSALLAGPLLAMAGAYASVLRMMRHWPEHSEQLHPPRNGTA